MPNIPTVSANTAHKGPIWLRGPAVDTTRGRSKSTRYDDIKKGVFPRGVKLAAKVAAWPAHEVAALVAAEITGATEDELRALVRRLEHARQDALRDYLEGTQFPFSRIGVHAP